MVLQKFFEQLAALVEYVGKLMKSGVPVYDAEQEYDANARVVGSDGHLYKSLQTNGPADTSAAVTDPATEAADPRVVWAREVPDPPAPTPELKPVAYGRVNADGALTSGAGATSARSGAARDYTYTITLDDALAAAGWAMISNPVDTDSYDVVNSATGFTVQFGNNAHAGVGRTFDFVIYGVK